jgi:hypothetical protein
VSVEKKDPGTGRPPRSVPAVPSSTPAARPAARPAVRPPGRAPGPGSAGRLAARLAPLFAGVPGVAVLTLLLWPTLLTLAVTLLRFVGELRGWSPEYFSRLPGGGLSPLGITWLAPLVGFTFGWRLERAGVRSPAPAVAFGLPAAALAVGPLVAAVGGRLFHTSWTSNFALWAVVSVAVAAVSFAAWPALGRVLLAYAYAARVPVVLVMAVAIWKGGGTHYDLPPPGFPALPPLRRWLWISVLPQMTIWVAWTMATGAIGAALGWRAASLRPR